MAGKPAIESKRRGEILEPKWLEPNGYGNSRIIIMIELRTVVVVGFQTLGLEVVRILSTFNPENGTLKPSTPGTSCWIAGCWVN
jgi:hypothetical protein